LIAVLSLAIVLGLKRLAPVVPASPVAVAFGVLAVAAFNLNKHGVKIVGH
jgi:MFS superfamily sulfate permease-like transporter